ncbi:carbohydrate kinase family protein [Nocardia brasiliensis]|uniref:carbohydrate kinase family protein n=1 Tax=Nocardia brasiliensis TaxID=37326 RepID=UPI001896187F|nr:carbohydrate kinase family protein [Nocardia brasiliensis]MBF6546964.1 carbohydrate kinase family protein [Nocardia brasiliensis]
MAARTDGPVVCISYLAAAELWSVPQFPAANHGATVQSIEHSVAADGPMTAAVLTALDVPTQLIANDFGHNAEGRLVQRWLDKHRVATRAAASTDTATPWIVVIGDGHQTRTWFAHLSGVADQLRTLDLSVVSTASFVYVDAYELIEPAALRAIGAAQAVDVPVLVNLGGSPLSQAMRSAAAGHSNLILQTNADDADHLDTPHIAESLRSRTGARWVIVTVGARGAVAVSRTKQIAVSAFPVQVRHTHCAGAAFFRRLAIRPAGRVVHEAKYGDRIGQWGTPVCTTPGCPTAES